MSRFSLKPSMKINLINEYLKKIEKALSLGNATEHTHRPALKSLLEDIGGKGITATNEPKRVQCGAPDFIITRGEIPFGYIEAKDVDRPLNPEEKSGQMKRYLEGLGNLILTDYLEFRWYVGGKRQLTERLAKINHKGELVREEDWEKKVKDLLLSFLEASHPAINNSRELADRMARLARLMRDIINLALKEEGTKGSLHQQMEGFRKILLHDLTEPQFADMYAQTICYGLFAARCSHKGMDRFTRKDAPYELPKTNPFLKKMFGYIAGPELDANIVWAVDDLAELLNRANISAILRDFGKRTRRQDPVVHFYEDFLAAYDPRMREARGVYYTPEPVVSYIVRSVDHLLKTEFNLAEGLADHSAVKIKNPGTEKEMKVHKVQILDPAAGTGTFLHGVIDRIHESFQGNKGMWSGYVSEHLLPRLYGFELLMAPYAVAHMKLGLQLLETGYDFHTDERLRVYLTNTLDEAHEISGLPLFAQWLADEANAAKEVKKNAPVMVVLGNPPYSGHSANTGEWIARLLKGFDTASNCKTESYFEVDGQPLGERNPKWLNDDYVKFIRFSQWRIEQTGYGILAFICNHGYLDNPTFRGMRQSLMNTFDEIYILDLHGNSKKKERCPDGTKDENVFDIQQGVAIGIFVKRAGEKTKVPVVKHADSWGLREIKYHWLWQNDISTTKWKKLKPDAPFYLFIPQDTGLRKEYEKGLRINDIMPVNSVGIVTARDNLAIAWDKEEIWERVKDFAVLKEEAAREKYQLGEDARDWKVSLAQKDIKDSGPVKDKAIPILYRPFDVRHTYYTGQDCGFICRPSSKVMEHLIGRENLSLSTTRSIEIGRGWEHLFCSRNIIQHHTVSLKEVNYLFPLYVYTTQEKYRKKSFATTMMLFEPQADYEIKKPNLSPNLMAQLKASYKKEPTPEQVFYYIYAVLYSPAYRERYAEFLKMDFPRIPFTSSHALFQKLCALGEKLVGLHLMEKQAKLIAKYPVEGKNVVEKVRYTAPGEGAKKGRVWINDTQYFEGIPPEIWNFHIGGYQVCQKWLKDRKDRQLDFNDLSHYQRIISTLAETIQLMDQIDQAINVHGGWPIF